MKKDPVGNSGFEKVSDCKEQLSSRFEMVGENDLRHGRRWIESSCLKSEKEHFWGVLVTYFVEWPSVWVHLLFSLSFFFFFLDFERERESMREVEEEQREKQTLH